jgi:hypothetical protein
MAGAQIDQTLDRLGEDLVVQARQDHLVGHALPQAHQVGDALDRLGEGTRAGGDGVVNLGVGPVQGDAVGDASQTGGLCGQVGVGEASSVALDQDLEPQLSGKPQDLLEVLADRGLPAGDHDLVSASPGVGQLGLDFLERLVLPATAVLQGVTKIIHDAVDARVVATVSNLQIDATHARFFVVRARSACRGGRLGEEPASCRWNLSAPVTPPSLSAPRILRHFEEVGAG